MTVQMVTMMMGHINGIVTKDLPSQLQKVSKVSYQMS